MKSLLSAPDADVPKLHGVDDGLSEASRLIGVFLWPVKTFSDLNRHTRWIGPFVLLAILNTALAFTIGQTIGYERMAEESMQGNPRTAERMQSLSATDRANQISLVAKTAKYFTYGAPIITLLMALLAAAVLMGTFNFGLGRTVRFGTSFSVVTYSMLPSGVYTLLAIMVLWLSGHPENVNVENIVATNPAFLFEKATMSTWLYALLRALDLFYIWPVVLAGIGFSAIHAGKRSTTLLVAFGWWIFLILVWAGLAGLN